MNGCEFLFVHSNKLNVGFDRFSVSQLNLWMMVIIVTGILETHAKLKKMACYEQ
jgi:hypothetical protein